jgi:predicted permease
MSLLSQIKSTFRSLFRKQKLDRDLDAELHSYEDLLTDRKVGEGMEPEQARRTARLEMGGIEQVKEHVRERRVGAAIDTLAQDIRHGFRSLRTNTGLSFVAILILAIGIGANTTLFTTISAALLGGLPYEDPARLVTGATTRDGLGFGPVSRVDYFDYREQAEAFEDLALIGTSGMQGTITGGAESELIGMGYVSWNLFSTLGVRPVLGRGFLREEEEQGDDRIIVISHALWRSRYGGSADVLGSTLNLDGYPFTIVGVLPAGFEFLVEADAWGLIDRDGPWDQARDSHSHWVVGRLAAGVTLDQAQGELDAVSAGLQELYPDTNKGKALALMGLQRFMVFGVRSSLLVLMGTTALVLLIACSNVAGLLLARGQRRMPEMAMRSALGASRWRLVGQLVTESVILTLIAGGLGVGLAYLLQDLIGSIVPMGDLGVRLPALDAGVLLFAVGVSIATGLAVGIVPALMGSSVHPSRRLRAGAQMTEGVRGMRLRGGLVVVQVGVSVVLLIGAGLCLRSLVQMATVDLGFDADNQLTAGVRIQALSYPDTEQRTAFFSSFLEEVETLPGVLTSSLISKPPILSPWQDWAVWPAEQERPAPGDQFMAMARWASPGYFETARIPVVRGRDISDREVRGAPQVVVVSEMVARALFPAEDPIGRMVGIGWYEDPFEIVGVVGDVRVNSVARGEEPAFYMASG